MAWPRAQEVRDDVVISGFWQSAVGRRLGRSALVLILDAVTAAVADACLTPFLLDSLDWPWMEPGH